LTSHENKFDTRPGFPGQTQASTLDFPALVPLEKHNRYQYDIQFFVAPWHRPLPFDDDHPLRASFTSKTFPLNLQGANILNDNNTEVGWQINSEKERSGESAAKRL